MTLLFFSKIDTTFLLLDSVSIFFISMYLFTSASCVFQQPGHKYITRDKKLILSSSFTPFGPFGSKLKPMTPVFDGGMGADGTVLEMSAMTFQTICFLPLPTVIVVFLSADFSDR